MTFKPSNISLHHLLASKLNLLLINKSSKYWTIFHPDQQSIPCLQLLAIVLIWQKFHFPATASKQAKWNLCSWTEKREKQNTNTHSHLNRVKGNLGKSIKQTFHMLCFLYTYFFATNDIFLFNVYWRRQSCLYYYFSMFYYIFFRSILIQTYNNNNKHRTKWNIYLLFSMPPTTRFPT